MPTGAELPFRLVRPDHDPAQGTRQGAARLPLILFLHGAGERGSDNQAQLRHLPEHLAQPAQRSHFPCFLLAPQCPKDKIWGTVHWTGTGPYRYAPTPPPRLAQVMALLDSTLRGEPAIDAARVYLVGLSMGGYGAWELGCRFAPRFAAVVPLCGGGDTTQVATLARTPLWAFHGDADAVIPVRRSREMIDALREAGGHPRYSELPGVGHDCWTPAYSRPGDEGFLPWLFSQRSPPPL